MPRGYVDKPPGATKEPSWFDIWLGRLKFVNIAEGDDLVIRVAEEAAFVGVVNKVAAQFVEMAATLRYMEEFESRLDAAFEAVAKRVERWDFDRFRSVWRIARQTVGLQGRLMLEQVFWDMGNPWRKLITGFSVIKRESEVSRAPDLPWEHDAPRMSKKDFAAFRRGH